MDADSEVQKAEVLLDQLQEIVRSRREEALPRCDAKLTTSSSRLLARSHPGMSVCSVCHFECVMA